MQIQFKDGNALEPAETGNLLLVHVCNDIPGCLGAGIAGAIAKKWPIVKKENKAWGNGDSITSYISHQQQRLGEIQVVKVKGDFKNNDGLAVVNLIGQRDVTYFHGEPPVRYQSILEGLWKVRDLIESLPTKVKPVNIVMPRIASALSGGSWSLVEPLINKVFADTDIGVTVYTFGPFNP